MKLCTDCNILLTDNNSYKYAKICKKCKAHFEKERRKTPRYMIKTIFYAQHKTVKNDKRRAYRIDYTEEELYKFCMDNNLEGMITVWKKSNYDSKLKPSVDRKSCNGPYALWNIQLITWGENNQKGSIERQKSIKATDSEGTIITFESLAETSRELKVSLASIHTSLREDRMIKGYYFNYL